MDIIITTTIGVTERSIIKLDSNRTIDLKDIVEKLEVSGVLKPDRIDNKQNKITWYVDSKKRLEVAEEIASILEETYEVIRQYPIGNGWTEVSCFRPQKLRRNN